MRRSQVSIAQKALVWSMAAALAGVAGLARASDPPELMWWKLNTTGETGYGGLQADVRNIRYSANNVYIDCSSIPDYSIGPWPGNPNTPADKAFLLRFPRSPVENTGTKTSTPLGPIGSWTNGVAIFNALDARSYMNQNIWHQNAIVVEATSFDACLGHPAPDGTYHHHQNASCLYGADPTRHSNLLGFAFDGFPLYGPYAFQNADGTGDIARMRSSYAMRNITVRQTLPDGTVLTPSQYGPPVSSTYPLGYYAEDYVYTAGSGDLDEHNGRFAVTPEYPEGIYAYYVTVDESGHSVYPYDIGPKYYGVVAMDDISSHGHVTVSEAVTTYTPPAAAVEPAVTSGIALRQNQPNPAQGRTSIGFTIPRASHVTIALYDVSGHKLTTLMDEARPAGAGSVSFDAASFAPGVYFYRLRAGALAESRAMLVLR
jgi:hypothetical protein